ncbi:hypothetical protein [Tengunoibacter tsumagoiensis]|uniref:1,4-alpha-glucan branching enzyme n=1 Tax=Tengunoibacter tsumagoiensis TaxID=2014871 RepID=A0A402A5J6_9CHLR|nr:hypothetical protein [Tengunoibacter tsumagoiensis]GCE14382.1 hypothetical protein KTT_42410 [Tengunoibacter tsumagoiensis]
MASESYTTTNHTAIRKWSEARGGKPSMIKSVVNGTELGLLRINFPGYSGAGSLEEISWDEFFSRFDEKHLAFLYQEQTSSGEQSTFCKFVSYDNTPLKNHSPEKTQKSGGKNHPSSASDKHSKRSEHKTDEKGHGEKGDRSEHKGERKAGEKAQSGKAHK